MAAGRTRRSTTVRSAAQQTDGAPKTAKSAAQQPSTWCVEANDATDPSGATQCWGSSEGNGAPRRRARLEARGPWGLVGVWEGHRDECVNDGRDRNGWGTNLDCDP